MNILKYGIYWFGLQTMDQLVQQWLSTNGRPKNPAVVLSMRLDVSAGFHYMLESQRSMV